MKKFNFIISFCIALNIFFFVFSNTRPIVWLQDEISSFRFYWNMDGVERLTLHTGLTFEDLKKPFVCRFTDGSFRLRQVSSTIEMLTYKLGQMWAVDYFRDYFLILLHLFNVFLFWRILKKWTGSFIVAWIGAILVLNSGAALATLFFPFRLAKILVIMFFLLAFNLLMTNPVHFERLKNSRLAIFSLLFFCTIFSDETALFLISIFLIYLWIFQGREAVFNKRILKYGFLNILIVLVLAVCFYFYSNQFGSSWKWHPGYVHNFSSYVTNPMTVWDIARSICLFLSRNFGYWELSLTGILAIISSGIIVYFVKKGQPPLQERNFCIAILLILLAKVVLLPHMEVHPFIMPKDTVFPSLLYFTYYYVYLDSFLIVWVIMILLFSYRNNLQVLTILMCCVTGISFCNLTNVSRGVQATLKFHELDKKGWVKLVDDIKQVKMILTNPNNRPVYLSFHAGNDELVNGRSGFDLSWPAQTAFVLTMYLPELERGDGVVSLKNIKHSPQLMSANELDSVKTFYDVETRQFIDIDKLKNKYMFNFKNTQSIKGNEFHELAPIALTASSRDLIFFVKGMANIEIQLNEQSVPFVQNYGEAYQLFWINLENQKLQLFNKAILKIKPQNPKQGVDLVGPFLINK